MHCTLTKGAFASLLALATVLAGAPPQIEKAVASADGARLLLGDKVLLQNDRDGFMSVKEVKPAPTNVRFAVIACGYECNDNVGFLFNSDGTGKRRFTARWDFILQDKVEWSANGRKLFYYRVNSSGADPPAHAPPEGWVEVDVVTGRKRRAVSRQLKPAASYAVITSIARDGLQVRAAPGVSAPSVGVIPADGKGVKATGRCRRVGRAMWAQVTFENLTGWVNQHFLYEQ